MKKRAGILYQGLRPSYKDPNLQASGTLILLVTL
jgi:hypothetical protein